MPSSGPNSGGTFVDDTSVGTITWNSPGNAASSNDVRASASMLGSSGIISHYLKATNFGFSIPGGSTIDGVVVEIERKRSVSGGQISDSTVKLVIGGVVSGNNKANTGVAWPTADAYFTYGSSSDTWGLSLTDSDINASTFGVVISVLKLTGGKTSQGTIDHIRITIHYTTGGGGTATAALLLAGD